MKAWKLCKWFTLLLERRGLRCRKCATWRETRTTSEKQLRWGSNCGDLLFMDPFHVKLTVRWCINCGHVMARKIEILDYDA